MFLRYVSSETAGIKVLRQPSTQFNLTCINLGCFVDSLLIFRGFFFHTRRINIASFAQIYFYHVSLSSHSHHRQLDGIIIIRFRFI